jgi:hypothetical protein
MLEVRTAGAPTLIYPGSWLAEKECRQLISFAVSPANRNRRTTGRAMLAGQGSGEIAVNGRNNTLEETQDGSR